MQDIHVAIVCTNVPFTTVLFEEAIYIETGIRLIMHSKFVAILYLNPFNAVSPSISGLLIR